MKEVVYKFLDKYIGVGYQCVNTDRLYDPYTFRPVVSIEFYNNCGIYLFRVLKNETGVVLRVNNIIVETIMGFIPVEDVDCRLYISNWFCEKNNIKKEELLMKYIMENEKLFSTAYW